MALRTLRERRGLTGRELANMTGISQGHISELENGRRNLTRGLLERIALTWKISVEELVHDLDQIRPAIEPELTAPVKNDRDSTFQSSNGIDDFHALAIALVKALPRDEAWERVRKFSLEAQAGDPSAAHSARALITILTELP